MTLIPNCKTSILFIMDAIEISLGFMEVERRVPRWFFPSKVGGLPAWQVGPPPTDLFCGVCTPQVPLTLLVQVSSCYL